MLPIGPLSSSASFSGRKRSLQATARVDSRRQQQGSSQGGQVFTVIDRNGRELSESESFAAARTAVRTHLLEDGEQGPLKIISPDGKEIGTAELDECGRMTIWTTTLSDRYETEVVRRWGSPLER